MAEDRQCGGAAVHGGYSGLVTGRAQHGRAPIARSEIAPRIHMTADGVMLVPAETISVFGNDDPASWEYVPSLAGPSNSRTVMRPRCRAIGSIRFGC